MLSVPKRLRYFLYHDSKVASRVLKIFIDEIKKKQIELSPDLEKKAKIGGVSFLHRFGASLNIHVHFHCVIIEGVFVNNNGTITFHKLAPLSQDDILEVEERVRIRVLKSFKRHDQLDMKQWDNGGGFSVDASVRIHENDREGLERLLRYCTRPAFSMERLEEKSILNVN